MRISVIIPTYNSGPLVVQAVESVLAQTRPADEIIVVDDGSTDDTQSRLRPCVDRICYFRQANARVAVARNTGLAKATGDLIAFLDADDAWHPCKLERQLAALENRPDIGLLATQIAPWPGSFQEVDRFDPCSIDELPHSALLVTNPLATSSIIVRHDVLDRAGAFDTELFGPEDYDLWLRCAQIAKVGVLSEPLTGYRDSSGSVGKQAATMRRGLLRIHEKLAAAGMWKSAWSRRKCRAHIDYSTAYLYFVGGNAALAAWLLLQSLLTYPLPMARSEVRYRWGRVRLLCRAAMSCCRSLLSARASEASRNATAVPLTGVAK